MALPGVEIEIGNGGLGRVAATSDGVAGLLLTGTEVSVDIETQDGTETKKLLAFNQHYQLSSTKDLSALGVTAENNPLVNHEVRSFYAQAGDGVELHLMVVDGETSLTTMVNGTESALGKLIEAAAGRIKLVGVNRLETENDSLDLTKDIDGDAITAAEKAHQTAESYAGKIMPFCVFVPAPHWTGKMEGSSFRPSGSSYNRVAMVLASEGKLQSQYPAAIGMVLGRAAKAEPQQDLGRVKFGSIASDGYFTDGSKFLDKQVLADTLNDAGYIFFLNYPSKNGCYLNGCPMACDAGDDYAVLNNGRIIDKAMRIAYDTYISEIMDNVQVGSDGKLPSGVCTSFESMIENAVASLMDGQISSFKAYVDPAQNILSTSTLKVECSIVPLGVLKTIHVVLAFSNPALEN